MAGGGGVDIEGHEFVVPKVRPLAVRFKAFRSETVDVDVIGVLLAIARLSGLEQTVYCVKRVPCQDDSQP